MIGVVFVRVVVWCGVACGVRHLSVCLYVSGVGCIAIAEVVSVCTRMHCVSARR